MSDFKQHAREGAAQKYSALSGKDAAEPAKPAQRTPESDIANLFPDATLSTFFAEESRRIQTIKNEVWALFANGQAHLPSPILTAANAYADALTLQLRLFSYRKPERVRAPKHAPREAPHEKP